jgi:molybdate transport system ATP-binding protein
LITFNNVTLRVRDQHILAATQWEIKARQNWAVLGPNGSGKSTLLRALIGEVPVVVGSIIRHHAVCQPDAMGYVSLEQHRHIIAREELRDESRHFSGKLDSHLTVDQFLSFEQSKHRPETLPTKHQALSILGVSHLRDRAVRFLSNGELRKILITKAILQSRGILLLDEPFEGLDKESRERLARSINGLMDSGVQIILATNRFEMVLSNITHALILKACRVVRQGPKNLMLTTDNMAGVYKREAPPAPPPAGRKNRNAHASGEQSDILVAINDATVKYGHTTIFKNLSWSVKAGENWAVVGPNGSGKSTLLRLVTADHHQAYANEIYLFGKRRGSGESVWEIKQRMGVVSSEVQVHYRKQMDAYDVVLSGFFDSVGLYRLADTGQHATARKWIDRLGLGHLAERRFDRLSYGERRMILLARAMVKSPQILVLDEPCQGLDPDNRRIVLELVEYIGCLTATQLLYVTHHAGEIPACISHVLEMGFRTPPRYCGPVDGWQART